MSTQFQTQTKAASQPTPAFTPVRTNLLQRKCACGGTPGPAGECAECRRKRLQRRATHQAGPDTVPPIVHDVLRSPGQPLDPATRAFLEPRLGHDFSQVRVHTDAQAAESARAVNAVAYTMGCDVVFGVGQYVPQTNEGRRLLAHELTHVVQQSGLPGVPQAKLTVSSSRDTGEREAEHIADVVSRDAAFRSRLPAPDTEAHGRRPAHVRAPIMRGVRTRVSSTDVHVARKPDGKPPFTVEEWIRDELVLKIGTDDTEALEKRRQRLRELFESVLPSKASRLYDRLSRGMKGDEFAKFFVIRLTEEMRQEMLGILKKKFSAEPEAPTPAQTPPSKEQMPGSLGITEVTGHWEFYLSGDHVMAVPTPGASCTDLADGTWCEGIPTKTTPIDVTGAFPSWVGQALAEQAASGIRFTQLGPESEVGGYHAFAFDLGYGNCHGFSLQLFQLFADVPITWWTREDPENPTHKDEEGSGSPPGVPPLFGMFPPREQTINKLDNSDKEPVAAAHYGRTSEPGGYRWIALIEVGDRVILSRVDYVGGTRTDVPVFGAWGLRKGKGMDHSVIALGRVGNDRVYILQKMSPMNPYYINVRHIVDFEWYQIPPTPTCSYEPGGRKSP